MHIGLPSRACNLLQPTMTCNGCLPGLRLGRSLVAGKTSGVLYRAMQDAAERNGLKLQSNEVASTKHATTQKKRCYTILGL